MLSVVFWALDKVKQPNKVERQINGETCLTRMSYTNSFILIGDV